MTPKQFVAQLAALRLPAVFNPYAENCDTYDLPNASTLRKANLEQILGSCITSKVRTIWVGRDLGYRGGRRTGVPLTDEVHLTAAARMFRVPRLRRATRGPVMKEKTAAVIWKALNDIGQPVVLWNVFPLHPHLPGEPMSNRSHTRAERDLALPLLHKLIEMIQPHRIVAIGRDAYLALQHLDVSVVSVRHPSFGGQEEFLSGIRALYGLDAANRKSERMLL